MAYNYKIACVLCTEYCADIHMCVILCSVYFCMIYIFDVP